MKIIGTGLGRTGTYSLRQGLESLGFGPCHHMEVVVKNMDKQVNLWNNAVEGRPDWDAIYNGFNSMVDWPTACFFRELLAQYPDAKFIHTERNAENWTDSFGATIYKMLEGIDQSPEHMKEWLLMVTNVTKKTGVPLGLDRDGLMKAFNAHNQAVREVIPTDRLLIYQVKEGWEPLCDFLEVPIPSEPFPRTNSRKEFWELVNSGS